MGTRGRPIVKPVVIRPRHGVDPQRVVRLESQKPLELRSGLLWTIVGQPGQAQRVMIFRGFRREPDRLFESPRSLQYKVEIDANAAGGVMNPRVASLSPAASAARARSKSSEAVTPDAAARS